MSRLTEAVKDAITTLARKLETIRANMIGSFYALRYDGNRRSEAQKYLDQAVPLYDRYIALHEAIRTHKADLHRLQKEKDGLPMVSIRKHRDLSSQIEEKGAEIAKLQKLEKAVMQCGKADHTGMQEIQKQITAARTAIQHVDDRQTVIHDTITKSKRSFLDLLKNPEEYDLDVLERERMVVRSEAEAVMKAEITKKTGRPIQESIYTESRKNVDQELENQQEKDVDIGHALQVKKKEKRQEQQTR